MNVIMFHSVGNTKANWRRFWLSADLNHFDRLCLYLYKNNYLTCSLDDWYEIADNGFTNSRKQVVLTFDDGYLDNWVFAYPILKKYGLKGTIFVSPEFVHPSKDLRPNYEDVMKGHLRYEDLTTLGFLNWSEIIELDSSELIDIQSHTMSHNYCFYSDQLIDVYRGQPEYDWLPWSMHPNKKTFYLEECQKSIVPFGFPIFEYGSALRFRKYIPDQRLIEYAVSIYDNSCTDDAISCIDQLREKLVEYPGEYEEDIEMEQRYRYELFESKKVLEQKLKKRVDYLCWPYGGYNERSIKLSIEAGYKASTIASWDSGRNEQNQGTYKRIKRFGLGSFYFFKDKYIYQHNKYYLVFLFLSRTGSFLFRNYMRLLKLFHIIRY